MFLWWPSTKIIQGVMIRPRKEEGFIFPYVST